MTKPFDHHPGLTSQAKGMTAPEAVEFSSSAPFEVAIYDSPEARAYLDAIAAGVLAFTDGETEYTGIDALGRDWCVILVPKRFVPGAEVALADGPLSLPLGFALGEAVGA